MDGRQAVEHALGAYRGPLMDLVLPLLLGTGMVLTGMVGSSRDWWAVAIGVFLFITAIAPATIVRRSGIILMYRFRRIVWTDVAAIQEIDLPRSRECLRIRRHDDRVFILRGVPADRLAGLMQLAHDARRGAAGRRP